VNDIPHERQPWLMNTDEGYEVPSDADRCEARYRGKYRCAHWKSSPHELHWALGGNLEWATSEHSEPQ
jgi:hypothetical protein